MSDETDSTELDAVRRLLADARHDAPMPADVSARMDAVLAGLTRHEPVTPDAEVIPLTPRRRRNAAALLVAAAAIVAGGVTVSQLAHQGSKPSASAGSSVAAGRDEAGAATANGGSPHAPKNTRRAAAPQANGFVAQTKGGRVVVRPRHFSADAKAAQRLLAADASYGALRNQALAGCVSVPADSRVVAATYDRAPAVLVYRRPEGSTQIVDLYLCGHASPARSVTLPLP